MKKDTLKIIVVTFAFTLMLSVMLNDIRTVLGYTSLNEANPFYKYILPFIISVSTAFFVGDKQVAKIKNE